MISNLKFESFIYHQVFTFKISLIFKHRNVKYVGGEHEKRSSSLHCIFQQSICTKCQQFFLFRQMALTSASANVCTVLRFLRRRCTFFPMHFFNARYRLVFIHCCQFNKWHKHVQKRTIFSTCQLSACAVLYIYVCW